LKSSNVSNWSKTLEKLMAGQSDASIDFDDVCNLLTRLGYTRRQNGSHNIFRKPGSELINLQNSGGKAKPYQVRQVRDQLKNQILP
jgi:predicted RNA binding protein YcfA (HicA-like mRNA interferase family)